MKPIPLSLIFCVTLFCSALFAQNTSDYVPGLLYVKVKNNAQVQLPNFLEAKDLVILRQYGFSELADLCENYQVFHLENTFLGLKSEDLDNTYKVKFKRTGHELELADKIMQLSFIEYAEVEPFYYTDLIPNDYSASQLWHLAKINAPEAWNVSIGDKNVVIAVLDAGFMMEHPDLKANIWTNTGEIPDNHQDDDGNSYIDDVHGWDAGNDDNDPNPPAIYREFFDHGTKVAGVASPVTDNNVGIAGIGYSCILLPIKAKSDVSAFNPSQTTRYRSRLDATSPALTYAIRNQVDVINMSFGSSQKSQTMANLILAGSQQGILMVAAAGNENNAVASYPASLPNVISVGATTASDRKASFSSYGANLDIMAPGTFIKTTSHTPALDSNYETVQGTSAASPMVAGLAGLMKSVNPCLSPTDIETFLKNTAVDLDNINIAYMGQLGAGRIDAEAAMLAVQPAQAPLATFTYDTVRACDGSIEFFYDGAINGCPQHISWIFNGELSHELNPVFQFSDTGSYQLKLIVENKLGVDSISQTIRVPHVFLVHAGGDENGGYTACSSETVLIPATASSTPVSARWDPVFSISNPNILNPNITRPLYPRVYTLEVTDSLGCVARDQVKFWFLSGVTVVRNYLINPGDSATMDVRTTASPLTYEWSPTLGLSNPFVKSPKASPSTNTIYLVTATTNTGCTVSGKAYVNLISSLADEFSQWGEIAAPFPNPASDEFFLSIDMKRSTSLQLTAYDLTGREIAGIFSGNVFPGKNAFTWQRPADLRAGIYMLIWQTPEARMVQKIQWK